MEKGVINCEKYFVAILFYSGDKRNQTSTKQIPLNISRQEKEAYINSVEPKMEKAQVRLQEDLFVVRIKRLSEKTIQRHTQCVQEELKDEKKEENNNEEVVVDVKKINEEFLEDIEISDDDEEGEKEKPNNNKPTFKPTLGGMMPQPAKKNEELSDYEALREKNMKDMRAMFLDEMKKQALACLEPKKTVVKHVIRRKYVPRPPKFKKIYGTRSRRNSSDEPLESLDDKVDRTLLYEERRGRGDDTDEEEEYTPAKRRRHVHHHGHDPNHLIRTPESITEEDLANVATCVSDKVIKQN